MNQIENNNPSYYAILTAEVRYDIRLNPLQKLLYAELTALANAYGFAWPSNQYLADLYGVSDKTISRNINTLKDLKYISVVSQKRGTGTVRKIYINHENIRLDKNVPSDQNPLDKNVLYPLDKNVPPYPYMNNTSNLIIQERDRNTDSVSNHSDISFKPTLSQIVNIGNKLKINKSVSEKFFYYYQTTNWTTKSNISITSDNLENHLQLWNSRELNTSDNFEDKKDKALNASPWLNEYLDELAEYEVK